jgi:hypothetical protein
MQIVSSLKPVQFVRRTVSDFMSTEKSIQKLCICLAIVATSVGFAESSRAADLATGFASPPNGARIRAYWWWLNGNVTSNAITRDLEEMKAKGWGGALICDAGGADQRGNDQVRHGPTFLTPEWRALYRHTLHEAGRLGLEMSLNIQSGWNLGSPMVTADDANKKLVWSETTLTGGRRVSIALPKPQIRDDYYRDVCVLAFPLKPRAGDKRPDLLNWKSKTMQEALRFSGPNAWFLVNSAPDTSGLLEELPVTPGEEDTPAGDVLNLTDRIGVNGVLDWQAPAGEWQVLRFGCTIGDHARVSTHSEGWGGYAIDPLDAGAFNRYWDVVVEPLIKDAGAHAGKALRYLHTDSWEVDAFNWTPNLVSEFRRRRGYDPLPYFPTLAGRIVDNRKVSNRFLNDFRRTLGDLSAEHFRLFSERAARHGLGIHPESGGPHFTPIDAQQCLEISDVPMSEFWAQSRSHRIDDITRLFVKQPASAAHVAGRRFVAAEGFTTVGPHWQEAVWDNLKPSFDQAICEGLNRLVWHAFVCSPAEEGLPGIQYFAGTHMNPNTTWWDKSGPFIQYMNRCQWMMQQGLFVADACYYYGDHVPNYTQLKRSDPARVLPGYDYDAISAASLLGRSSVKDGRLVLPDGMSYRVLVLPNRPAISLPVLRKVRELVEAGVTIVGPPPVQTLSLADQPKADAGIEQLADQLWGEVQAPDGRRNVGKGRVVWGKTAREVLLADGVKPDFEANGAELDYTHRRDGAVEIYFVSSRANGSVQADCCFRVSGKAPELWDAVTGERRFAAAYEERDGCTVVPLEFAPCGSWFVVFRRPAADHPATAKSNAAEFKPVMHITGSWTVAFDPAWGGPASATFDKLESWTDRAEPGIKFYSGTATYRKTFELNDASRITRHASRMYLDLGDLRELAEVKVNGQSCGIAWCPPFRVDISRALKPGPNELTVEVVNFWPNRITGDAGLPKEERLTRTNIRQLNQKTPLMKSGLFGPVTLLERQ